MNLSVLGYMLAVSWRAGAGASVVQALMACIHALAQLALAPPLDSVTHLALAGTLTTVDAAIKSVEAVMAAGSTDQLLWERDRQLLATAGRARSARSDAAWKRLKSAL